jgi:hypothetical protein
MPDASREGIAAGVWQVTPRGGVPALLRFSYASGLLLETEIRLWGIG